jgi:dolichyl-diphosphooligosaccharide--protein glycosyltransferase
MLFSIISLGFIITSLIKKNQPDKLLFLIWSLVVLIVTLSMRRFAYYFSVNVALLTGYLAWLILSQTVFKASDIPVTEHKSKKKTRQQKRKLSGSTTKGPVIKVTGLVVVIVLVIYPNIGPLPKIGPFPAGTKPAIDTAKTIPYIPDNAWCEACDWLKENTPEPFGDPDYYYANYENLIYEQGNILYDDSYSVTAWWDFGYWITRMGHRVPSCNPGSGKRGSTARFFTAQNERAASRRADKLDTKYIIIDFDTTTVKFYALVEYSGNEDNEFYDIYFKDEGDGLLRGDYYFYPEYYKSMAVRLYNFDGRETIPDKVTVILYEDRISDGENYKYISGTQTFPDYKAARKFIKNNPSGNYNIVGMSPFETCVPLQELELYEEIYGSDTIKKYDDILIPQVKIFEYTGTL